MLRTLFNSLKIGAAHVIMVFRFSKLLLGDNFLSNLSLFVQSENCPSKLKTGRYLFDYNYRNLQIRLLKIIIVLSIPFIKENDCIFCRPSFLNIVFFRLFLFTRTVMTENA